ncbi:hypothetical protein [Polyangium jinanense]|uniref:Uncharacterized protein n=1 Tax=Polyangium jinanense TaxID=2829994 RepID=A0A9X3X2G6_9BACT|nr:hypothetical protein [Polyangium jinanense]MDC3952533.1 hypothetical protein [Polyangium jinanense]MDC3980161.1 hypothetical protein [Polyangium jinanense]
MSNVAAKPYTGPLEFSLKDCEADLVDLAPGAMSHLRFEHDGLADVLAELATSVPALGDEAGISPKVYQRLLDSNASIDKLAAHELVLAKALEVVRESRAKKVHERENDIAAIVDSAKSTARRGGDKGLLAAFEKTIKYNAQVAEKAAKTRRKNAEAVKPAAPTG